MIPAQPEPHLRIVGVKLDANPLKFVLGLVGLKPSPTRRKFIAFWSILCVKLIQAAVCVIQSYKAEYIYLGLSSVKRACI